MSSQLLTSANRLSVNRSSANRSSANRSKAKSGLKLIESGSGRLKKANPVEQKLAERTLETRKGDRGRASTQKKSFIQNAIIRRCSRYASTLIRSKHTHLSPPQLDPSHLAILQLGVSIWNQWRANEPLVKPNLRNADLSGFHLENVNLCRADLRGANLSNAYLYEADFQEADLRRADLTRAGLIGANLHRANLAGACIQQAYLSQSDLSCANLKRSNLCKADLQSAILTETLLAHAKLSEADFSNSFDLTAVQLAAADDVHLADFSDTLRLQLGLTPKKVEPEIIFSQEKRSCSQPLQAQKRTEGIFYPTPKTASTQAELRELSISEVR